MLQAVNYMHENGIVHLDLKPENILLDDDFNIKIADFGFSAEIKGQDGSGRLQVYPGTPEYMAPEVLLNIPYQGNGADLFSLGVILFILYAGIPPFEIADPNAGLYKYISENKVNEFWK